MKLSPCGIDLAKAVFQVQGVYLHGKPCLRKQLLRAEMLTFFVKLEPCLIGMEACGGAHYWIRKLTMNERACPAAPALPKTVSGVDYVQPPRPDYPLIAKHVDEEGKIRLRLLVSERGRLEKVDIQQSSGRARLDEAARQTALRAVFKFNAHRAQRVHTVKDASCKVIPMDWTASGCRAILLSAASPSCC